MKPAVFLGAALFVALIQPAFAAPAVTFGDDSGSYANDGECDDPRFEGEAAPTTVRSSDDVLHDATDCKTAFDAGKARLRGIADDGTIDFGDDKGEWSNDGECDDLRFKGDGLTATALLESDVMHDATDCKENYARGRLELNL